METTTETNDLDRAVAVGLALHYATLDSKLLKRMDRWDIFCTRMQSAAESSETLAEFLEAFARKLEVGSIAGSPIAAELRDPESPAVRVFRGESVAVVALMRAEIEARREAKAHAEKFGAQSSMFAGGEQS
jgi:hypothetical protein